MQRHSDALPLAATATFDGFPSWSRDPSAGTTARSMAHWLAGRGFLTDTEVTCVGTGGHSAWRVTGSFRKVSPLPARKGLGLMVAPTFQQRGTTMYSAPTLAGSYTPARPAGRRRDRHLVQGVRPEDPRSRGQPGDGRRDASRSLGDRAQTRSRWSSSSSPSQRARSLTSRSTAMTIALLHRPSRWMASTCSTPRSRSAVASTLPTSRSS